MNIGEHEKLKKNYEKIKGYAYKITHILALNCPRVANLANILNSFTTALFSYQNKKSKIYSSCDMSNFVGTLLSIFLRFFFSYF